MKVFIDFDGVILNTKKFTLDLEKIYFKNGISKSKILEYKKLISDNSKNKGLTYKLERVIRFLKKGDKKCQERILSSVNIFY